MSRGKYSPNIKDVGPHEFNCRGEVCPPHPGFDLYDSKVHFGDYDKDGYDRYGYSCFDEDGNFVGHGEGIDRNGYTEYEYLSMDPYDFDNRFF